MSKLICPGHRAVKQRDFLSPTELEGQESLVVAPSLILPHFRGGGKNFLRLQDGIKRMATENFAKYLKGLQLLKIFEDYFTIMAMPREYPEFPIVSVGGLVVKEGKVLLTKRGKEPLKDVWTLPGGAVEVGESLKDAIVREIKEECGIEARPLGIIEIFEQIFRDSKGVRFHYVIVDFLLEFTSGEAMPGSDTADLVWVTPEELERFAPPRKAVEVILRGLEIYRRLKSHPETLVPFIKVD